MNFKIRKTTDAVLWKNLFRGRDTSTILKTKAVDSSIDQITFRGDTSLVTSMKGRPRVAVIGTCDPSPYGRDMTKRIVEALADNPAKPIIISGLAIGVDTRAHACALQAGLPSVAVMPTGIDNVYPFQNKSLAEKIASAPGSCLISQFDDDEAPIALNFLLRNSVIATISDLVIVVESKAKGGAIMTAKYAHDLHVPVLAVPGRIDDRRSAGCNDLITKGAADILADVAVLSDEAYLLF